MEDNDNRRKSEDIQDQPVTENKGSIPNPNKEEVQDENDLNNEDSQSQSGYRYMPYPQRNSHAHQKNRTFIFDSRAKGSRKNTYNKYGEDCWNEALGEKVYSDLYHEDYEEIRADYQKERKDSKNIPGNKVVIKFDTSKKKSLRDLLG